MNATRELAARIVNSLLGTESGSGNRLSSVFRCRGTVKQLGSRSRADAIDRVEGILESREAEPE